MLFDKLLSKHHASAPEAPAAPVPCPEVIHERILGCLMAGALGDALGYTVEFDSLSAIRQEYGPGGIRELVPQAGKARFSDDTQMTLFTLEGLLNTAPGQSAVHNVWRAYLSWLQTQAHGAGDPALYCDLNQIPELNRCRAPGNTCLSALHSGTMGTMDKPINHSKGCGGVMRTAPLGFSDRWGDPMENGCACGAITHGHPMGWVPSGMLSDIVYKCLYGGFTSLRAVIEASLADTEARYGRTEGFPAFRAMVQLALTLSRQNTPDTEAISSIGLGWVGDEALAVAIYSALKHETDLRACLISAVNHSGDSDSTGAIAGNILGAWLGASYLPLDWVEQLELTDLIRDRAARAAALVKSEADQ